MKVLSSNRKILTWTENYLNKKFRILTEKFCIQWLLFYVIFNSVFRHENLNLKYKMLTSNIKFWVQTENLEFQEQKFATK